MHYSCPLTIWFIHLYGTWKYETWVSHTKLNSCLWLIILVQVNKAIIESKLWYRNASVATSLFNCQCSVVGNNLDITIFRLWSCFEEGMYRVSPARGARTPFENTDLADVVVEGASPVWRPPQPEGRNHRAWDYTHLSMYIRRIETRYPSESQNLHIRTIIPQLLHYSWLICLRGFPDKPALWLRC